MLAMRTGRRMPLLSPDEAAAHPDLAMAHGDAVEPHRRRRRPSSPNGWPTLAERTGADELMISTMTYGLAERMGTLEIVAEVWTHIAALQVGVGR